MRHILCVFVICMVLQGIVCPPVNPNPQPKEKDSEADQDTGLHYDRYLKEVVMTLEEDPEFRKKLEEANVTDIKSGKIAMHLEKVAHHVREKLDEIKRKEVNRLRMLAKEKMKQMQGIQKIDESALHHVDVQNPHSFEMKDLERLIQKATKDLDELDKQRREEFKTYEMEKEHERREHLKELPEEERKKEEQKQEEMKKKHRDHPKLHHPGSKDQFEEVWEKDDHLDKDSFDPKTFFMKHDLDGNRLLDEEEIEALFQKELDQVYDPNNPEDDMEERYEEMSRMREHVMKELDKDGDKLVSLEEFMQYTKSEDFNKDEGWDTLENEDQYTEEELKEYERMLMEEENRRRQQGAFDSHAQPGVVNQPLHPGNVQEMQMPHGGMPPQGGFHPQGGMPPQGGFHPQGGMPQQGGFHPQGGMPQQGGQFEQLHPDQVAAIQQQAQLHAQQQAQFHAQQQAHAQQAQLHAQQQQQAHAQQQAQLHAQQQQQAQAGGQQPPIGQQTGEGHPAAQAGQGQPPVQAGQGQQGHVDPHQGQPAVQQTGQVPAQGQQQQVHQQQQGQQQQQQGQQEHKPMA